MWNALRQVVFGSPLQTQQLADKRLSKFQALAAFSPDALSSIAYANQEIYLGLVVAGAAGLMMSWPIGLAITALLTLVALSYAQTVRGYPSGGGSYIVARQNLGTVPGLVTASALLIDYLLTAAVSLTAGVDAIASAFPGLWPHRVGLALLFLVIITLINLRGVRESGTLMAFPVYGFLVTYLAMIAYGCVRALLDGQGSWEAAPAATQPVTTWLTLRAFAAGCTALTGIEAISNGVPAFHPPEARNARRTLLVMALLMALLFVGSIGLTQYLAVVPLQHETILSALARRLLGSGAAYLLIQVFSTLILVVAANTSFAGFPRLAAILATDGFLPRQLAGLGDRLVYSNGIVLLSLATGVLIVIFGGNSHALIPLFASGVFLAFTLSQIGMVVHWWRERGPGWLPNALVNGVGALATGVALLIIAAGRFVHGAWITAILIPLLTTVLLQIRRHYQELAQQLRLAGTGTLPQRAAPLRVVIPVSGAHRGIAEAISVARTISNQLTAVYIELEPGAGERLRERWVQYWPDVPLVIVPSPYRSIIGPLLAYFDEVDRQAADGQLTAVVLPEFVPAHWWQGLLHNQSAWLIKTALLYRRRHLGFQRVIIDVAYHLQR